MDDKLRPDDEITIDEKFNIANARKDIDNVGGPYDIMKDMDDYDRCSEWAIAYAMQPYNVGDTMLAEEFNEQLKIAILQQYMDHMIELGYMEAVLTEKNEIGYRLTPSGTDYATRCNVGL